MSGEILFRQLGAPVVSWSHPNIRWVVELWADELAYPVGQAWVMDHSATGDIVYLDRIHVMPKFRRRGIATKLLETCIHRWPELCFDAVTYSGKKFVKAFTAATELFGQRCQQ